MKFLFFSCLRKKTSMSQRLGAFPPVFHWLISGWFAAADWMPDRPPKRRGQNDKLTRRAGQDAKTVDRGPKKRLPRENRSGPVPAACVKTPRPSNCDRYCHRYHKTVTRFGLNL